MGDVCDDDDDGDGTLDVADNCRLLVTPDQTDTNRDGIGNRCDADYGDTAVNPGDGVVNALDFSRFKDAYLTGDNGALPDDPGYNRDIDADSDGTIGPLDFAAFKSLFLRPPGPSGLVCAGQIPCPVPP